ncbi:cytochrome P450 [Crepidotus variabilis]|uniref:Cytochrome P450 n=1 Tax=Crepidotus variabilis TaxID=179855 RepID=A0A9P6EK69_9AGAR|nr:cytochrome P450 [Crepidotus variabilis]
MGFPPGVRFLASLSLRFLIGPFIAYCILTICDNYLDSPLSSMGRGFLLVFSTPILVAILLVYKDTRNFLAARAMGATLPPYVGDWTPGSILFLKQQAKTSKNGYITDNFAISNRNTFIIRILFQNRIVTREPEQMKTLLATDFDRYEKGEEVRDILQPFIGEGVFAADGDLWKFHRTMTRPFFTRDRISDFDNFDRHATQAMERLKERFRQGYPVNLQDMAARFTLDSATEFLFGYDVHSLSSTIPYPYYESQQLSASSTDSSQRFANALAGAQIAILQRARFADIWPIFEMKKDNLLPHLKEVHSLIDPIVRQAIQDKRQRVANHGGSKVEEETLLQHLVNSTEDPTMLRDEIMSLLLAGRDTTASLISFVVYMLAEHPPIMHRLRTEILSRVGSSQRPSYEDIRDMKFLRAVLNETLRLYPPVPYNLRMSKVGSLWPGADPEANPFYVPAKTRILVSVISMHRRKDLWGPDADEFDPDRFLDERLHKYLTPRPFIFLPFNAGPRICLGQQAKLYIFAYNEASFFLVRLLQNFSGISLALDAQPPETCAPALWAGSAGRKGKEKLRPRAHLTMYLEGGLWVNMKEANPDDEV